jgi:biopolymer transport protein ExbB/TolQ
MTGIIRSFQEGGVFMYFILVFGLFTVAFVYERANALFIKIKEIPANFRTQILNLLSSGDVMGAQNFAQSTAMATSSALARITAIGCQLRANGAGDDELQARMDEALSREISTIDKRTGFLGMFGNVATLLGLLGTIAGMIHSFAAVASASPADRATMLSLGISEAMNCTAFGLIVAIPALVAFAIFQNRTDKLVGGLTENTTEIFNDLLFLTESDRAQADIGDSKNAGSANRNKSNRHPAPNLSV